MKKSQCMPRMMAMRSKTTATPASPITSLLERFREVVFKLIMLSAMLKTPAARPRQATTTPRKGTALRSSSSSSRGDDESYRSEAVEDCIEFVKRSAGIVSKGSAAGCSPVSSSSSSSV